MESVTSTTIPTKRCAHCFKVMPIAEFYENKIHKDGHSYYCKECTKEYNIEYKRAKRASTNLSKTSTPPHQYTQNPEFADKTPRELISSVKALINELRARGYEYEGKLTYLQTIAL